MKSLKYIVALALAAGLFQACDLERYPLTDLSEETFWNSCLRKPLPNAL